MNEGELRYLCIEFRKSAQAVFLELCGAFKIDRLVDWMDRIIERSKRNGD